MSVLYRNTVRVWSCSGCGRSTTSPLEDGYGSVHCPEEDCGAELSLCETRDARYVTVAVYSVGLAYGGPEEGGWHYHVGSLVPGTQRSFTDEDQSQAEVYQSAMLHRYRDEQTWVRVFCEEDAPAGFPRVRPRYC